MITKQLITSLIDLTSLNSSDNASSLTSFCKNAETTLGKVAAVCIYKEFIPIVKQILPPNIKIATVINFPLGTGNMALVIEEIKEALSLGAEEIDLVIPYYEYFRDLEAASLKIITLIEKAKQACGDNILKIVIESGELKDPHLINRASINAIEGGADFLKTSTGKTTLGATVEAAKVMLQAIKESGKNVGFKASGGIKTYPEASNYISLATSIMGIEFINKNTFRFGASSLLFDLLADNNQNLPPELSTNY